MKIPDELGAEMIVHLQKMAGIDETIETARISWSQFNDRDRLETLKVFETMAETGFRNQLFRKHRAQSIRECPDDLLLAAIKESKERIAHFTEALEDSSDALAQLQAEKERRDSLKSTTVTE